MDRSLALTLLLSGLLSGLMAAASRPPEAGHGGPLRPKRLRTVQVLGFDWKNCGQPDAPAVLRTLALTPDPISIPGDLTAAASGATAVELAAPLSVLGFDWKNCGQPDAPAVLRTLALSPDPISIPGDLTAAASGATAVELAAPLSKEVAGFWVRVPCVEELGSCHYGDACAEKELTCTVRSLLGRRGPPWPASGGREAAAMSPERSPERSRVRARELSMLAGLELLRGPLHGGKTRSHFRVYAKGGLTSRDRRAT
ncbi:unnamed protein product [Menidia menidia]|uniref:(Atlantic silverside) hypothetical protein n=1 Tax=Menidia menidia TaxID=238744 RepID=A0A8S4BQR7_9TELE|nr:unnamed protein product [Menidia menidia]